MADLSVHGGLADASLPEEILWQRLAEIHNRIGTEGQTTGQTETCGLKINQFDLSKGSPEKGSGPMSTAVKQILNENRAVLVENMVPDDLYRHLLATSVLTSAEVSRIKEKGSWDDINTELLNHIIRKPDSALTILADCLRESCQPHLADLLISPGSLGKSQHVEEVMSRTNRERIICSRVRLAEDITPDELLNTLISEGIITTAEVSRIKKEDVRESMNELLLDYIVRRADRAFSVFVDALISTGQQHLANFLTSQSLEPKRKKLKPLHIVSDISDGQSPTPMTTHLPQANHRSSLIPTQCPSATQYPSQGTTGLQTGTPHNNLSVINTALQSPDIITTSTNYNMSSSEGDCVSLQLSHTVPQSDGDASVVTNSSSHSLSDNPSQPDISPSQSSSLEDVKQQIMYMAENAYANIRRKDETIEAFKQFSKEMAETTESINDSLTVFSMIKKFCQGQETEDLTGCDDNHQQPKGV